VFIVKFPVIVVLVYVATSLVNEDEYLCLYCCFLCRYRFLVNKDLYIILAFNNEDLVFHIGIVIP